MIFYSYFTDRQLLGNLFIGLVLLPAHAKDFLLPWRQL